MKYLILTSICIVFICACTWESLTHKLEVLSGTGGGLYEHGSVISVAAAPAPEGQGFFRWEGDTTYLENSRSPLTQFRMPLRDAELMATYKALPLYELIVKEGAGSGKYLEGTQVPLIAREAGSEERFVRWTGDIEYVQNSNSPQTLVSMPAKPLILQANFEKIVQPTFGPVSFSKVILPMINMRCSLPICHARITLSRFTNYEEIEEKAEQMLYVMETGYMPKNGPMPKEEIETFAKWIQEGKKNN